MIILEVIIFLLLGISILILLPIELLIRYFKGKKDE